MRKFRFLLLSIIIFLMTVTFSVKAASINTTNVTLYALDDTYKEYLTIPDDILQSYQLKISGSNEKPSYTVTTDNDEYDGPSIEVDANGKITPRYVNYYCKHYSTYKTCSYSQSDSSYVLERRILITGTSYVTVKVGTETFKVTVEVKSYATYNAEKIMQDYVKNKIPKNISQKEQMQKILDLISTTNYDAHSSSYVGLFSGAGADCIGDSDAIIYMCNLLGITAHFRNANRDVGAGSGHVNVAAILDGKLYVVDVMSTPAPRRTEIDETYNGFSGIARYQQDGSIDGTYIQYDGYDEDVSIPTNLSAIAERALIYGEHSGTIIKTLTVPKTLTTIGSGAFNGPETLTKITIDVNNPNYLSIDDMVYTKDKTHLVTSASGKTTKTITVDSKTTVIEPYALSYNNNVEKIILPDNLEKIDYGAFYKDNKLKNLVVPTSVEEIGNGAIDNSSGNFQYWVIKNSNVKLGSNLCNNNIAVFAPEGSTAKTYAEANKCPFVAIDINNTYKDLATLEISFPSKVEYQGNEETIPNFTIKDGTYQLKENVDYTVSYTNNQYIGKATARIIGIGKYIGFIKKEFEITYRDISNATITGLSENYATTDLNYLICPKQNLTLTWNNEKLQLYSDYNVSCQKNSQTGAIDMIITGSNLYYGSQVVKHFNMVHIDSVKLSLPSSFTMKVNTTRDLPIITDPVTDISNVYRSYSVKDYNIAYVYNGKVTTYKTGSTQVTMTVNGKTYQTTLNVINYIKGDINEDDTVDVRDAREALYMAVGKAKATSKILEIGDMDANNKIEANDAVEILRIYLNK